MKKLIMVVASVVPFLIPPAAMAIPAISCHCFTDRSFDPARPAAADPYFLAAMQNSLLAEAAGMEKRTIVLKKQQGISADDLWIAYWVAARAGGTAEDLLQAKQVQGSWRSVVTARNLPKEKLGSTFSGLLASGGDAALSAMVVNELLARNRLASESELAQMRKSGGSNQEVIAAAFLARKNGQSPGQVLKSVKTGGRSWGELLRNAKLDGGDFQKAFSAVVTYR